MGLTMKYKAFFLVFLTTIFASTVIAKAPSIRTETIKNIDIKGASLFDELAIVCVDGYKYIYVMPGKSDYTANIIQMYQEKNGRSVPVKCFS